MICVHHGSVKFDPNKWNDITNRQGFPKPFGGLWSSPITSEYSWKIWCLENYPEAYSPMFFKFEVTGNIVAISDAKDILALPSVGNMWSTTIDFEKCAEKGIDAIHLTEDGVYNTRFSTPDLYGWDCETVLVLRPTAIREIM